MVDGLGFALGALACVFASVAGFLLRAPVLTWVRRAGYRRQLGEGLRDGEDDPAVSAERTQDLASRVIDVAMRASRRASSGSFVRATNGLAGKLVVVTAPVDFKRSCLLAGLKGRLNAEGLFEARLAFALGGAALGFVVGFLGSVELGLILGLVGFAFGWRLVMSSVSKRIKQRADDVARELPEMLDVVSLGLRSGLTFDRSLEFYLSHFNTVLARSLGLAYGQYTQGLMTREDALQGMAATFESVALSQVVGNVVRSLRFGASLAEQLEDAAQQARADYRARKEEEVAKAPVKMMIPTGTLILPAMLILVLGPVLLELAGGI